MNSVKRVLVPLMVVSMVAGCASSGKKAQQSAADAQTDRMNQMLEQIDRNAASVRSTQSKLDELSERLAALETKINTATTDQSASVQEMKENMAFMNDQLLRLDGAVRTNRPVPRPSAPSAFKPGGFDAGVSYKGALDEYYARRYESAISGFNELLTVAPNHDLADNAQYWIGESYYAMGQFSKALDAFVKVFDFPKSNKLPDAHYKVGLTHLKLGSMDAARDEFRAVVQNYSGTSAAKYAGDQLSKMGE